MKIPDMNEKNTRAFLDKVRERASSYTPEWRMDLENPDGGTALALLFAGMYEDTLKKYAKLPRKSMLDFFNCVGTALAPARPAGGYAVFGLVNQEADGTEIRRGTGLLARPEEDQEEIIFETRNDVYVTPSRICDMVQSFRKKTGYTGYTGKRIRKYQEIFHFLRNTEKTFRNIRFIWPTIMFST